MLTRLPYCRRCCAAVNNNNNNSAAAAAAAAVRSISSAESVTIPTNLPSPAPIPSEAGTFDKTAEDKRKSYRYVDDSPVSSST